MSAKIRYRRQRDAWYVDVYEKDEQYSKACGRGDEGKAEAEALVARINADEAAAEKWKRAATRGAIGVESALRHYLASHAKHLSPGARATNRSLAEAHLIPYFGEKSLGQVTDEDLSAFAAAVLETETAHSKAARRRAKAKGLKLPPVKHAGAATAINAIVLLRRVANLACKKGGPLKEHSLEEVGELLGQIKRTHGSEAPRRDAWTKEEAGVLLDLAKERAPLHYGPLLCAFSTGARQGEILGLEWPQVDLARGEIHFSAQLNRGQRKLIKWDRKGKGRRAPISPQLAAHLRELQKGLSPFEQQGPVFRSPTGKAWNARYFARGFDRLIRWAHRGKSVRLLTWHSTRHSFISWALEAGHQVLWVSEIVGAKPPVIFSNYAHVIPQEKRDLSFCAVG